MDELLRRERIFLLCWMVFSVGCAAVAPAPSPGEAAGSLPKAEPPASPEASARPAPYDGLLRPWHPFEASWVERAGQIVVGTLEQGRYPSIFEPDGRRITPARRTIAIERVLEGVVARPSFDLAGVFDPALEFPLELEAGRRYLVFLSPGEGAAALLADPARPFTARNQLQQYDLVAMVDLDQTEEEAREHRRRASRWRELEAFAFTAEGWRRMRESPTVDLGEIEQFFHAIRETEIAGWVDRAAARAALGPPDERRQEGAEAVEVYHLNLEACRRPVEGTLTARIELTFGHDGERLAYAEKLAVYEGGMLREATHDEQRARGLTLHEVDWRRTRR